MKRHAIAAAVSVLAMTSTGVHAQTVDQLKDALSQAKAAAAQATAAANEAQNALQKVLAVQEKSSFSSSSTSVSTGNTTVDGLTITNGVNSATLYGLIDITYVNQNNADTSGHGLTSPRVAWFSGNRWGITGKRELGDGLKAIYRLESEFESQTGNMDTPGVLFNRDSWLGFESESLGKLTFGRQNALGRDPAASAIYGDPYGSIQANTEEGGYTNNNNFKQLIFYAGSATGTRLDNGVVWKKKFDRVVTGLAYGFGTTPGSFNTGATTSASLAYNGDAYTVSGFMTNANIAGKSHQTYSFGGNFELTPIVRIYGGYFNYKAEQGSLGQRKDDAYTISTKISPKGSKFDYQIGYQTMRSNNAGLTSSGFVQNAFSDTSAITATATGDRNTLYASAFYHIDKATELYVAADKLNTTGGYKASQAKGFASQNEVGVGVRFKF